MRTIGPFSMECAGSLTPELEGTQCSLRHSPRTSPKKIDPKKQKDEVTPHQ